MRMNWGSSLRQRPKSEPELILFHGVLLIFFISRPHITAQSAPILLPAGLASKPADIGVTEEK